ncbi:MAG TPA: response regulator transcription factor [Rhizomicrobium sp.]
MPSPKRILLADPDTMLRAALAEQLAGDFEIIQADDLEAARRLAGAESFEFILLGFGPQETQALVRHLRETGLATPIILLCDGTVEAEAGLAAGASDTVLRPFRLAALLGRLHAHLRCHKLNEDAAFAIGPYQFRPHAKSLTGAKTIRLTEKETDILLYLHSAGATVARETLLHEVWGYNPAVTTHTLETHIYRLRRKIGPAILITDEGGYRLADV